MLPLQPDTTYHIFNHANGFENVFWEAENYRYFLEKYKTHIFPIAETYAYCLMPNHFHLVVRMRKKEVVVELMRNKNNNNSLISSISPFPKFLTLEKVEKIEEISDKQIELFLSKQFANLFSSYTQSFNKMYKRMGSLFIKNFKRRLILDKDYFMGAIVYIHRNPIHHHFRNTYEDWIYSSYNEIVEGVCDIVEVDKLIKTFGGMDEFIKYHFESLDRYDDITD